MRFCEGHFIFLFPVEILKLNISQPLLFLFGPRPEMPPKGPYRPKKTTPVWTDSHTTSLLPSHCDNIVLCDLYFLIIHTENDEHHYTYSNM